MCSSTKDVCERAGELDHGTAMAMTAATPVAKRTVRRTQTSPLWTIGRAFTTATSRPASTRYIGARARPRRGIRGDEGSPDGTGRGARPRVAVRDRPGLTRLDR